MPVPIFEFSVLSFGPLDLGPNQRSYQESVWEDQDWEPGEWLGEVEIYEAPSKEGPKIFIARFRFNDGTTAAVSGDLPNGMDWRSRGTAWAQGGGQQGEIFVEGRNPKRWG
jgi:hypothetical protein